MDWRETVRTTGITLLQVAERSGLHERTVSEALGGYGRTRPDTLARIQRAVDDIVDRRAGSDRRTESRGGRRISDVPKVACPKCGDERSCVVDADGPKRRRECVCGCRFNTVEVFAPIE